MDSRLPPWEQNPAGPPPPSRLCPQGHLLALIDGQPPSYNGGWMCDMCSAHLPPHTNAVLHCESAVGRLRCTFVWFMVAIQVPFVDSTCAPRAKSVPPLLLPELRSIPPPPCISICTLISIRQAGAFANVVAPKLTSFLSF
jgi:hypothetical protein